MIYDYPKASIGDIKRLATSKGLTVHTLSPSEDMLTSDLMLKMYKYIGVRSTNVSSMFFSVFQYGKTIGQEMRVSTPRELLLRPYYYSTSSCTNNNIVTNFHYISGPYVSSILHGYADKKLSKVEARDIACLVADAEKQVRFEASNAVFFVTDAQGYPYLLLGRSYGYSGSIRTKKKVQELCEYAESMKCGLLVSHADFGVSGSQFTDKVCTPRYVTRAKSKLGGFTNGAEYYDNMVPTSAKAVIGKTFRNTYRFHVKKEVSHLNRVLFKAKTPISALSFDQQDQEFAQYKKELKELVSA